MPELRRHHGAPEQRTRGATDRAETAIGLGDGRQRDGGISKFSIGTANTPLLNGITAFVHTYGDWCLL
jgi:hypothetical protein